MCRDRDEVDSVLLSTLEDFIYRTTLTHLLIYLRTFFRKILALLFQITTGLLQLDLYSFVNSRDV